MPEFKTIGIIGGTGQMGRWFQKYFEGLGHTVLISGRSTDLTWRDLARECHAVALSMPLKAAVDMAGQVGPLLSENQLLMDMCSLKKVINQAMESSTRAQVIGTHPLFGPSTSGMEGQNVIVCPVRADSWLDWLEAQFKAGGALVTRTDGATHDRNMAVVQGLTHFITIAFGRALEQMGIQPQDVLPYATPIFRLKLNLLGRMFAQDVSLYRHLICNNSEVPAVLDFFIEAAGEVAGSLCDDAKGAEIMDRITRFLGSFPDQGMMESDACLHTVAMFPKNKPAK